MTTQKHPFHLVDPSPWPLFGGFSGLAITSGFVMYMHGFSGGGFLCLFGFLLFLCFSLQLVLGLILAWMFFNLFNCCWFMLLSFCDFEFGFFVRSLHIVFVSLCFCCLFLHFCKLFLFFLMFDFSFCVLWVGFLVFFLVIVLTFLGYVLPCTQMSY